MLLLAILVLLIILFILFKRSFNQYASGLREEPGYFLWLFTRFLNYKGWTTEEHCLRTSEFKSESQPGYLNEKDIPFRRQPRPKMLRAVPHRQLSQHAPDEIMHEMRQYVESISIPRCGGQTIDPNLLLHGKSAVEYTGAAGLFLPNADQNTFEKGEVAHLHSNDGSHHMILHPSDAKLLLEQQWAERFPLAGRTFFNGTLVPDTFVLVYAPQNTEEVKIWKKILHAAIDYNREKQRKKQ